MIPAETVKLIQDTAVEAAAVSVHKIPGDDRVILVAQGGERETLELPPPPRNHRVRTLEDIAQAAAQWGESGVVWVGQQSVILVADDADRRDCVELELAMSDKFSALKALRNGSRFSQKDLLTFLRVAMHESLLDPTVIGNLRAIKFSSSLHGHGEHAQGRDSLGRSVESAVLAENPIPETIGVKVPVYTNPGCKALFVVRLDLEVHTNDQSFSLTPLPDEIEKAEQEALAAIKGDLEELPQPIFFGAP